MEIILEIIVYLLVVLGLITVCFTFFNKFNLIDTMIERDALIDKAKVTYARDKRPEAKLVVNIRYRNIEIDELENIKQAIETANYVNINDIADEVNYIDSSKKTNKKISE